MKDDSCVFCKIIAEEIPSYVIGETDGFKAILDIARITEGHTIIIPKDHYETIWDVPDIGGYFTFVQEVGNHFRKKGFKYVDTLTLGRMVPHAHVHVIPHNGDNTDWEEGLRVIAGYQTDTSRHPSPEEGKKLAEKYTIG